MTGPRFAGMDLKQLLLAKGGSDIRKEIRGVHLFLQNLLEVEPGKRWTAELVSRNVDLDTLYYLENELQLTLPCSELPGIQLYF